MGEKGQIVEESKRIRVFVSSSYLDRSIALKIRNRLGEYGLSIYIAHNEREVSPVIRDKIIENITSSDIFVCLLTKNFFTSEWTMQEAGAAVGLQKVIISVSVDADARGYLSKYDVVKAKREADGSILAEELSNSLLRVLYNKGILKTSEIIDGLVNAVSFTEANSAAQFLKELDDSSGISIDDAVRLFVGAMDNLMVKGSFKASKILSDILDKYRGHLPKETVELLSQKKVI